MIIWFEASRRTHGTGASSVITPPRNARAPVLVIDLNMECAASGSPAESELRQKELDARVDAAIGRYVCTKKVNVEVNEKTLERERD